MFFLDFWSFICDVERAALEHSQFTMLRIDSDVGSRNGPFLKILAHCSSFIPVDQRAPLGSRSCEDL